MEYSAPQQFFEKTAVKAAADRIAQRLHEGGFEVLYAGGWVRDLLLNRGGEDIDIATNADPEILLKMFPKAIQVGIAFGIIRHIQNGMQFEIASFRKDGIYLDGRHPESITLHATAQEDAMRRDFTINGLFFDPFKNVIIDYVGGVEDIQKKEIRTIGKPIDRFSEDRLRIIRAIRFKNSLHFSINEETWKTMQNMAEDTICHISQERIFQELDKMHRKAVLGHALLDLYETGLLTQLFIPLKKSTKEHILTKAKSLQQLSKKLEEVPHFFSTILAIALIFPESMIEKRSEIMSSTFSLSNKELQQLLCLTEIEKSFLKGVAQLTEKEIVELLSLPYALDVLFHLSFISQQYEEASAYFLSKNEELLFWVEQLRSRRYHVSGQDFLTCGYTKGPKIGMLIKEAFSYSLQTREINKEIIIQQVLHGRH